MSKESYADWFNVYYSQNMEDLILNSFFFDIEDGFYIDVGAHDPVEFSVTKLFYDRGWKGVNIEPQEKYYERLRKMRPRDINLNVAIDRQDGAAAIREYLDATGLSTISDDMKVAYPADSILSHVTMKYRDRQVQTKKLSSIFRRYVKKRTVHFLKIDVEGLEGRVLSSNDWKAYRPLVLCVEANHIIEEWQGYIESNGYALFMFDGLNQYYIAQEEYKNLTSRFNYAKEALGRIPIHNIPFSLFTKDINKLRLEQKKLKKIINNQDSLIRQQEEDIIHKNTVIQNHGI